MTGVALYGTLAEYYDRIYSFKDYARDVDVLLPHIRRYGPAGARRLLDVGCGTGRHLEAFRRYFEVSGVDASAAMLRVARRRLGPRVPLWRADMRSLDLGERFDVIVCLFSAIGYLLTRRDRDRALRRFYDHLVPGGLLLVEGWILPERFRGTHPHLLTYDGPDVKVARLSLTTRRRDRSYLEMHYLVAEEGGRIRHVAERHVNALVPREELLGSFARAGFRARVLVGRPYEDRGLYLGVRPTDAAPVAAARRIGRARAKR